MKLTKGLFSDSVLQDTPTGSYTFAKNIVSGNVLGSKENEDGFIEIGLLAPFTVIGIIPIGKDFIVFSTNNTQSEIGKVVRNGEALVYTQVLQLTALNFNTNYPIIDAEFRIDVNNQRTIIWTDNYNPPRILNVDNPSGINSIEDLNVFRDIQNPKILDSRINDTGGALKTGAYVLVTRYKNTDGSITDWFVHDHVFYINSTSKSGTFEANDGAEGNLTTNKSIGITLSDCDTRYDTIEIGYIATNNNITTAVSALTVTNSTNVGVTISGNESATTITLDEILVATTSYNTAKTLTQLAGRVFLGNLTAEPFPDLQLMATFINLSWSSTLVNVVSNTGNHKDNLPPVLIPGEVYAFYLGVELNKGGWRAYHIPGRSFSSTDKDTVTAYGLTYKRYQVEDTMSGGTLGYWENIGETYPNNTSKYGTLANQPVRHHRMPTLKWLGETIYSSVPNFGTTTLPSFSITANNVIIPPELQSKIKRWKIFYAKKDVGNSLVLGNDLLQYAAIPDNSTSMRWSSGGNWKLTAFGTNNGNGWVSMSNLDTSVFRGHNLDYLYNKTLPNPSYVEFSYRLRKTGLGTLHTGFQSATGFLSFTGQNGVVSTGRVVNYSSPFFTLRQNEPGIRSKVSEYFYLPQNSQIGNYKSARCEGSFIGKLTNPTTNLSASSQLRTSATGDQNPPSFSTDEEWSTLVTYYNLLDSVHTSFTNQTLIPLEGYYPATATTGSFVGGNGFMCLLSYTTISPVNANPDETIGNTPGSLVVVWRSYIGYSTNNFNYRYQTAGDIPTYYFPKTDVRTLFNPPIQNEIITTTSLLNYTDQVNKLQYNTDYNVLNEYLNPVIYNVDLADETSFPNTIIYTPVQSEESKVTSWRSFLAGDRYITAKNKGQINNLQGLNNRQLLIHTESSLFRTRTDIQVATQQDVENVFFKSASLFELPPEEVLPVSAGYAGTQHNQSCILTKAGYFFVDNNQGKAFLYSGELQEISSNGLRNFFRDFMQAPNVDNAFTQTGYTSGYDERNNRLLVTKKNGSQSWTISYDPQQQTWISYHDYIPDHMFTTVDNILYSVKNNKFYIHNLQSNNSVKGKFYEATPYSSYIDVPFNPDPQQDKLFTSINWVTEVYPNTHVSGQQNTNLSYFNTFTHITLRGLDHCSGRIPLISNDTFNSLYSANMRNLNRSWYFNDIRDIALQTGFTLGFYNNFLLDNTKLNINTPWYNKRRFVDKLVICRLEYDNLTNNRILLLDSGVEYNYLSK